MNPQGIDLLLEALRNIAGERGESKKETTEGRLVSILRELTDRMGAGDDLEWSIKTADILRIFNEDRTEDHHVSGQWIGKKLKSMSLRRRTVQGRSEILLSFQEYRTLLDQYGCEGRESPAPTETLPEKNTTNRQHTQEVGSGRGFHHGGNIEQDEQEQFEEIAALLQFETGMSREAAEQEAARRIQARKGADDGPE